MSRTTFDAEENFLFLHAEEDSRDNLSDQTIHSLLSVKINNTTECHKYKQVKAAKKVCTSYLNQCASAK